MPPRWRVGSRAGALGVSLRSQDPDHLDLVVLDWQQLYRPWGAPVPTDCGRAARLEGHHSAWGRVLRRSAIGLAGFERGGVKEQHHGEQISQAPAAHQLP